MTLFFCRSTTALLAFGSAILGPLAISGMPALALSQEQINAQLGNVPVFTLSNSAGNTLTTSITNSENEDDSVSITQVFISPTDAENALESIRADEPEFAEAFQVTPIPLSQIYAVALEMNQSDENVIFDFIPIEEEVDYALSLLPNAQEQTPGRVPLFLVSATQPPEGAIEGDVSENEAENVARFTLTNGVIPMFFKQEQFDNILSSIEEDQPEIADTLFVDVIWLETFISVLANSDDDDTEIQQYQMIPTAESIDFVQDFEL